jgi:hypothetical protein
MDDAHVEQDLGCIRNLVEPLERFVELIVVVVLEGLDPSLDFLYDGLVCKSTVSLTAVGCFIYFLCCVHTCFNDMLSQGTAVQKAMKPVLGPWESDSRKGSSLVGCGRASGGPMRC